MVKTKKQIVKTAIPCPICGGLPKISDVFTKDEDDHDKLNCSNRSIHISCGDWFDNIEDAVKDWERRTTGYGQPEHYHPTNLEFIKSNVSRMNADEFADALLNKLFNINPSMSKEQYVKWLDKRRTYNCCTKNKM